MDNDEDMLAQIANIEAQLSYTPSAPSTASAGFGSGSTFGGSSQPPMASFPRQPAPMGANHTMQQPQQAEGVIQQHQFSKDTDDRSIFIAGLPTGANGIETTPEELAQFFQECGPMRTVTVLRDRKTNELKGTAYIEFNTHEAAGRAIDTKNNSVFKGSTILVCWVAFLIRCHVESTTIPPTPSHLSRPLSRMRVCLCSVEVATPCGVRGA